MGKKNDVPLKEKYRLWVEYLKRDEELMSFLNSIKEKEQNAFINIYSSTARKEIIETGKPKTFMKVGEKIYIEVGGNLFKKIPVKYVSVWAEFRIVLRGEETFEEWWDKWHIPEICKSVEDYFKPPTKQMFCRFDADFEEAIFMMKVSNKQAELLLKFKKVLFSAIQKNASYSRAFLSIVYLCFNKTNEELVEDFLTLVNQKRKEPNLNKTSRSYKKWRYPLKPFYYDQLKRYLRVYDLRKERKTYSKIQGEITKEFGSRGSYSRTLPDEYRIAKQIINNAALGFFPFYQRKQQNRKKQFS